MTEPTPRRGTAFRSFPVVRRGAPLLLLVLLGAWGAARATLGVDFGDGSHAVELAMRMAQGDVPFRDEMNLQVLGAWPAVPFVWAWLQVFGIDGIVLASRLFYVAFVIGCVALCWRALAPHLGRGTTAVALAVAVIPTAYNQQVISYNTTPGLLYLVAVCTAAAATASSASSGGSRWGPSGWAIVSGVSVVGAAMSHPVTAPGAVVLVLVSGLLLRRRALLPYLVSVLVAGTVVLTLTVVVWGVPHIVETISFTRDYQRARPGLGARFHAWEVFYKRQLATPLVAGAFAAALLAAVPRLLRLRIWLLLLAVSMLTFQAAMSDAVSRNYNLWSWLSGILGTCLVLLLLAPATVAALRRGGLVARVLVLGAVPSLVSTPLLASFTSSAPLWGAAGAALAPALFAVVLATLSWIRDSGRLGKAALGAVLIGSLVTVHTATSFRDGPPGGLTAVVADGAFAHLRTTPAKRTQIVEDSRAVARCAPPGAGVLGYLYPAAWLLADVRFATPIIWLDDFRGANRTIVDWIERTGRAPVCVVASKRFWPGYGRSQKIIAKDPLVAWILRHYSVTGKTSHLVLLTRDT